MSAEKKVNYLSVSNLTCVQIKSRHFYSKFKKAKDLNSHSEDDIAAVLGTKKRVAAIPADVVTDDTSYDQGIQTIVKTESIWDYFKQKKTGASGI